MWAARLTAGASLACYGMWFGQYPYGTLTIVDPPSGGRAAGGMEYPTLITIFADAHAPDYATGLESVTIHEFGHFLGQDVHRGERLSTIDARVGNLRRAFDRTGDTQSQSPSPRSAVQRAASRAPGLS